jgi:hypothetical protein
MTEQNTDYVPDRESWIRGYAQSLYDNLLSPQQPDWPAALIVADREWGNRYEQIARETQAGAADYESVGVRYCVTHHGLMEEDMSNCDMVEPTDDTPCDLRELVYKAAQIDSSGSEES